MYDDSLFNGNKGNGKKCETEPCEPSYNMSLYITVYSRYYINGVIMGHHTQQ